MADTLEQQFLLHTQWKPFSLTLVEYPAGDLLGQILAASSLLPLAMTVAFATAFAVRRDLHTFTYGVGVILNYALNSVLKVLIGESRPAPAERDPRTHFNPYGMPSAHAQFMWFVAAYMCLFVLLRLPHQGRHWLEATWKAAWLLLNVSAAAVVVYGRVYLAYHTLEQVAAGTAIGCLFAYVWFWLTQRVFTPYFPYLASTPVARFFLIRDLTSIPHVADFEYRMAEQEVQRLRKME